MSQPMELFETLVIEPLFHPCLEHMDGNVRRSNSQLQLPMVIIGHAWYLSDMDKPVETKAYQMSSFRHVEEGWMEFDAGRLGTEENGDNLGKLELCRGEWEIGN